MACAPLMGNHEAYDLHWQCRLPLGWLGYFPVPGNGSRRFPGWYYSFDYGPCHFVMLNTQWEEVDSLRPGLLAEQMAWLRRDMAASRKKWKIVLMHKDIIEYDYPDVSDPRTGDISATGRALMPLFDELRPDVVLTAHQQMLAQPERGNYMTLEASAERLRFSCFLPDGSFVDEVILQKVVDI